MTERTLSAPCGGTSPQRGRLDGRPQGPPLRFCKGTVHRAGEPGPYPLEQGCLPTFFCSRRGRSLSLRGAKRRGNPRLFLWVPGRRKGERIPTAACGRLGRTESGDAGATHLRQGTYCRGAPVDARRANYMGRGGVPPPVEPGSSVTGSFLISNSSFRIPPRFAGFAVKYCARITLNR